MDHWVLDLHFSILFSTLAISVLICAQVSQAQLNGVYEHHSGEPQEGKGLSFVLAPGDRPSVSFYFDQNSDLMFAERVGTTWQTTTVDITPDAQANMAIAGAFSIISSTSLVYYLGAPHIIYFDRTNSALKHAYRLHGQWNIEIIDSTANTGGSPSANVCGSSICVSYYDEANENLRFARGKPGSWTLYTVDSGDESTGAMNNLAVDSNGVPYIVYYDATNKKPRLAVETETGSWNIEMVPDAGNRGMWPDIKVATDGTIYLNYTTSKTSNLSQNDGGLTLAAKSPSGHWTFNSLRSFGGPYGRIELTEQQVPVIAYRGISYSAIFGNSAGAYIGTLQANGIWTQQSARFGASVFYSFSYNLALDTLGDAHYAYYYTFYGDNTYIIRGPQDDDADGLADNREEAFQTDPELQDSDGDGLSDGQEILELGSSPKNIDSDGDGTSDDLDPDPLRNDQGNLVIDGSMDAPTFNAWSRHGLPTQIYKDSSERRQGLRSLHLISNVSLAGVEQRQISTQADTRYLLSLRYKRLSGEFKTYLGWNDSSTDFEDSAFSDNESEDWQYYTRYFTTPSTAGDLRLVLLTNGEVLIDDVTIVSAPLGEDIDADGVLDSVDNCPLLSNPGQEDLDGDSSGDACDSDLDGDEVLNSQDCDPADATKWQTRAYEDQDNDGIQNSETAHSLACFGSPPTGFTTTVSQQLDNCPNVSNPDQQDFDLDTLGDACDDDADADGTPNDEDCNPLNYNAYGLYEFYPDYDRDNWPESLSTTDTKTVCSTPWGAPTGWTPNHDVLDNCPFVSNWEQTDTDTDGIGDNCDDTPDGGNPNPDDNQRPTLVSITDQNVSQSKILTVTLDGNDTDNDPLTYSASVIGEDVEFAATVEVTGNIVSVTPPADYLGKFRMVASVSDGELTNSRFFNVSVMEKAPPSLQDIPNQTVSRATSSLQITLQAVDPENNELSFSASIKDGCLLAYELDQEYNFSKHGDTFYYDLRGKREKYLYDMAHAKWFVILPDGRLYNWTGDFASISLLAALPPSYYDDPEKLIDVLPPEGGVPAYLSVEQNLLTILFEDHYVGSFTVVVEVSNEGNKDETSFLVTRKNHKPELSPIDDRALEPGKKTLEVALDARDLDGDGISFSATIGTRSRLLFELNEKYQFGPYQPGNYYYNSRGKREKYLYSSTSKEWFALLPTGELLIWKGSFEKSTLLALVPHTIYKAPETLFSIQPNNEDAPATLTINGSTLNIQAKENVYGTFYVKVKANDGDLFDEEQFALTIKNHSPSLREIQDVQLPAGETETHVDISATDADNDSLTFSADALEVTSLTFSGDTLIVKLKSGYSGSTKVTVEVTDGTAVDVQEFVITIQEAERPLDSDGDGVSDEDELNAGTDPFDAGSFKKTLESPVYTLWNSFLEMTNILEMINPNDEDSTVAVYLYAIDGSLANQVSIDIPARSQYDLILNDLEGFEVNSYGIVKLVFNGLVDGRVFYYRLGDSLADYEFAFGIPLSNPSYGKTNVTFNTYQPSTKPEDLQAQVANWLTIVNLDSSPKRFSIISHYSQNGETKTLERSEEVPAFGRRDIDGGHCFAGNSIVGSHEIVPSDPLAPYIAQLIRYGGNAPAGQVPMMYQFAFPLVAKAGTGRKIHVPISKQFSEDNWLEIANTLEQGVWVSISLISASGDERAAFDEYFGPYEQRHIEASTYLQDGESGIATVDSSIRGSVIAQSMFYFRDANTGGIQAMYGSQAREALGRVLFGSYNLFLGMENYLRISNNSDSTARIQVIVNSDIGSVEQVLELPANGSRVLSLHQGDTYQTSPDTYGTVETRITQGAYIFADLLRIRNMGEVKDFAAPTLLR